MQGQTARIVSDKDPRKKIGYPKKHGTAEILLASCIRKRFPRQNGLFPLMIDFCLPVQYRMVLLGAQCHKPTLVKAERGICISSRHDARRRQQHSRHATCGYFCADRLFAAKFGHFPLSERSGGVGPLGFS